MRVNRRRTILHRTGREPFADRVQTGRSLVSRRATACMVESCKTSSCDESRPTFIASDLWSLERQNTRDWM